MIYLLLLSDYFNLAMFVSDNLNLVDSNLSEDNDKLFNIFSEDFDNETIFEAIDNYINPIFEEIVIDFLVHILSTNFNKLKILVKFFQ